MLEDMNIQANSNTDNTFAAVHSPKISQQEHLEIESDNKLVEVHSEKQSFED